MTDSPALVAQILTMLLIASFLDPRHPVWRDRWHVQLVHLFSTVFVVGVIIYLATRVVLELDFDNLGRGLSLVALGVLGLTILVGLIDRVESARKAQKNRGAEPDAD